MVVTSNGRSVAILASIPESGIEDTLRAIRQAMAVQAVAELQRQSLEQGTDKISLQEINAEIDAVRRNRVR